MMVGDDVGSAAGGLFPESGEMEYEVVKVTNQYILISVV